MVCFPLETLQWPFISLACVHCGYWRNSLYKVIKGFCSQVNCSGAYLFVAHFNNHILLVSKVTLLEVFT